MDFDLDYDSEFDSEFDSDSTNDSKIANMLDDIVFETGVSDIIMSYKIEMDDVAIIEKYDNDWVKISNCNEIDEYFMEKYIDNLYWYNISESQILSENFILNHPHSINYLILVEKGKIEQFSDEFFEEYILEQYNEKFEERQECEEEMQRMFDEEVTMSDPRFCDDHFDDMSDWMIYNGYDVSDEY